MELTLQHLRLLREVARQSTITAAADALGYTRSAVSQQLMGLERSTGVAVLERVGRNVRLTDAGRVLVRHADEVLTGVEAAEAALEAAAGDVRGLVEIGIYESIAAPFLAPLVTQMSNDHPQMTIRSREIEPEDALDALLHGDLDLAFTLDYAHDSAVRQPDVMRTPIAHEHFVAVTLADDRRPGRVDLATLAERPFIAPSPDTGCGRAVVAACRQAGFEPDIVHQVDAYPTALDLVAAGLGVAVVPRFSATPDETLRISELRTPVTRTIEISHRRSSTERPMIEAIVDFLVTSCLQPDTDLAS
ncbi:MAG: LysR family transcriptional regulator [Ilumatobacter sp.]